MCLDVAKKRGGRVLVVTPRYEISKQWAEAAREYGWTATVIGGGKYDDSGHVVCSTMDSARNQKTRLFANNNFDLLIIDEAHRAASETGRVIMESFKETNLYGKILLTTATPGRSDGQDMSEFLDSYPIHVSGDVATLAGALMTYKTVKVELPKTFNHSSVSALCNQWQRNGGKDKQAVFFVDRVAHIELIVNELRRRGVTAEGLSGQTPKTKRRQILQDYDDGRLSVIVNVNVLTEGIDINQTSIVVLASQPATQTPLIQRAGRALGRQPGKHKPIIIVGRPRGAVDIKSVATIDEDIITDKRLKGVRHSIWSAVKSYDDTRG
jgi:superfamily II DNA or RNA helicase